MRREGSTAGNIIYLLFGPIVWAAHLGVSYAGHATLCVIGETSTIVGLLRLILGAATMLTAALLVVAVGRPALVRSLLRAMPASSPEAGFATRVMQMLALLALLGVSFSGMAMLILPFCELPR